MAQPEPSSRRATPSNPVLTALVAIGIRMSCLEKADAGRQRQDKMTPKILVQKPEAIQKNGSPSPEARSKAASSRTSEKTSRALSKGQGGHI